MSEAREEFEKLVRGLGLALHLAYEDGRGYIDADTWKAFAVYQAGASRQAPVILKHRLLTDQEACPECDGTCRISEGDKLICYHCWLMERQAAPGIGQLAQTEGAQKAAPAPASAGPTKDKIMTNTRRGFLSKLGIGSLLITTGGIFKVTKDQLITEPEVATLANTNVQEINQDELANIACSILDAIDGKNTNSVIYEAVRHHLMKGSIYEHTSKPDLIVATQIDIIKDPTQKRG